MTEFDEIRFSFRETPADQKLIVLRSETYQRLLIIKGFAELLRRGFDQPNGAKTEKIEEYKEWLSKIIDSTKSLQVMFDAIALPQYRETAGLPELRPYESLLDAVRETAQKLNLPLSEAIDDGTRITIRGKYPLVLMDEPKYHREISFQLANSKYVVTLLSWIDDCMFQEEHAIHLSNLGDVATVINYWLLEQKALKEIQDSYPT